MPIYLIVAQIISLLLLFILVLRRLHSQNPELSHLSNELSLLSRYLKDEVTALRNEILGQNQANREELSRTLKAASDSQFKQASESRAELSLHLNLLNQQINKDAFVNREELSKALNNLSESLSRKLQELTSGTSEQGEKLKLSIEISLEQIRSGNETKLEEMRKTVDEKLHATLEKRLGKSSHR